ncbi:unnamed protein product [Fusarium venenatum]|uniref:L-lactate dehydrogenase n=2 Tax=Fusarium venenatum TaxID=56646 RepID=A0A2L2SVN6_9HYPO|nr:uncharacterized protein FVRRES_12506 [Fusarium venenatum]CEI39815.1 unnamed protein product [Fusarium venenatum]
MNSSSHVAIVGVGEVGGVVAYNLIISSVVRELLLVDLDLERRNAQVEDLSDAAYSTKTGTRVRPGTFKQASQCDVVVITSAVKHTIGQTTVDYTSRNCSMLRGVIDAMKPFGPETILLIVADPVDLLTSMAKELSGLPSSQVMGTGTFLDTDRLCGMLASRALVMPSEVCAYVVGIHGERQIVAWSSATIGGVCISDSPHSQGIDRERIETTCKHRSQELIRAKGSAGFGIGTVVANICSSILSDKRIWGPVSFFQPQFGCCFSMPAVIGKEGIVSQVEMVLDGEEESMLSVSAVELKRKVELVSSDGW